MQTDFCSWLSNPAALQGESLLLGTPRNSFGRQEKAGDTRTGIAATKSDGRGSGEEAAKRFFVGIARAVLLSALEALEELNLAGVIEVVRGDAVDVVHIAPDGLACLGR